MIKPAFSAAGRVTGETSFACILISRDPSMFIVHVGLVVLMAIDAAKYGITGWVGMTFGTAIPFTLMLSRINGEILFIMIKSGRLPSFGSVTGFAFG